MAKKQTTDDQPKRKRPPTPSPEDFIRAWQGSASLKEVARKLGFREAILSQRANIFRKRGIPLKSMRPGPKFYSAEKIEDLKKLAESLAPEED